MIDWVTLYAAYAVSGAFISTYTLFLPAAGMTRQLDADNIVSRKPVLGSIVWFVFSAIAIPFITLSIISPKYQRDFTISLAEGFIK